MTEAQIRYHQLVETRKHNREQEENWRQSLLESVRHNREQERLSQYSTDTGAATSRYGAEVSAAASKYSADQRLTGTEYQTDVNAAVNREKLAFEKYATNYKNQLAAFEYKLDKMRTEKDVQYTSKQIEKLTTDMRVALDQLQLNAKELGLTELRTYAQNALDRARMWESYSKTAMNVEQLARAIAIDIRNVFKGRLGSVIDKVKKKFAKDAEPTNPYAIPDDFFGGGNDPNFQRRTTP